MTASPIPSREIRLRSRPEGTPKPENFALAEASAPPPGPGEVQVRNRWMSVDPYMRGRMTTRKSYVPPFELDAPLQGGAIGEVVASETEAFAPGDLVQSMMGWREAFTAPAAELRKLPELGLPPEAYLGVAGLPGLTAFVGVDRIARVQAGEVVFVSAASGAVGSVACQLAKIRGATVIGSAGGPEKCAYLKGIGVDHVIDYKAAPDLTAALDKAAPRWHRRLLRQRRWRAPGGGARVRQAARPLRALRHDLPLQRPGGAGTSQHQPSRDPQPAAGGLHRLRLFRPHAELRGRHGGLGGR